MGTDLSAKLAKLAAHVDAARDGVAAINRSEPLAAALYDAYRKGELVTRADAQAAVEAERVRMCHLVCPDLQFMVDSIAENKAYVAEQYPKLFAKIQARRAEMGTLGGVQVFGEIARDLLAAIREVKS